MAHVDPPFRPNFPNYTHLKYQDNIAVPWVSPSDHLISV